MDRKLKNTLILLLAMILIGGAGAVYKYVVLKKKLVAKQKQVDNLSINSYDTEELKAKLSELKKNAAELDSVLAMQKYNIPSKINQADFYDFVNKISFSFAPLSYVNIEFRSAVSKKSFNYFEYKVSGIAYFNDLYKLIYAIEQSKQLKKIASAKMINLVKVDDDGIAHYLVNFELMTQVYFANTDRFTTKNIKENRLKPNPLYDIFYPLIRKEIPPNINNLLDVQSAQLLALVPDGAFLADGSGNTFLLWEGDEVYLGYLTEIDYDTNKVTFILNKGGIIEKVVLELQKENTKEKSK